MQTTGGKELFISHAAKDEELANLFVDFLQTGLSISHNQIFCSSLEGLGIPAGVNFIDFIKNNISGSKVVIALLTPSYFNSQFCLCELGATWVLQKNFIPLVVPPITFEHFKAVLIGIQGLKINDESNLDQMAEKLGEWLIFKFNITRFGAKRKKFLTDFTSITIANDIVSLSEIERLRNSYSKCAQEAKEFFDENEKLKTIISDLEKCRNKEETQAVQMKHSTDHEQFEALVKEVENSFCNLHTATIRACFDYLKTDDYIFRPDENENTDDAIAENEIKITSDGMSLNKDDLSVQNALHALSSLKRFLDDTNRSLEFCKWFHSKYKGKDLESISFWRDAFNVSI